MSDQNNEKKELTPSNDSVKKDLAEALKLLHGGQKLFKGLEKKILKIQKASERVKLRLVALFLF